MIPPEELCNSEQSRTRLRVCWETWYVLHSTVYRPEWSTLIDQDQSRYCALIGWTLLCWCQGICHNNTLQGLQNGPFCLLVCCYGMISGFHARKESIIAKGTKCPPMQCLYLGPDLGPGVLHSARGRQTWLFSDALPALVCLSLHYQVFSHLSWLKKTGTFPHLVWDRAIYAVTGEVTLMARSNNLAETCLVMDMS